MQLSWGLQFPILLIRSKISVQLEPPRTEQELFFSWNTWKTTAKSPSSGDFGATAPRLSRDTNSLIPSCYTLSRYSWSPILWRTEHLWLCRSIPMPVVKGLTYLPIKWRFGAESEMPIRWRLIWSWRQSSRNNENQHHLSLIMSITRKEYPEGGTAFWVGIPRCS